MKIKIKPDTTESEILFFNEINLNEFDDTKVIPLFGANGVGKTTLINAIVNFFEQECLIKTINKMENKEIDKMGGNDAIFNVRRSMWRLENKEDAEFYEQERERCRKKQAIEITEVDTDKLQLFKYNNSSNNFRQMDISPERGADNFMAAVALRWNARELSEGQSIVYSTDGLFDLLLKNNEEDIIEKDKIYLITLDEIDSGLSIDNIESVMKKIKRITKKYNNVWFIMSYNNPYINKFYPKAFNMYNGLKEEINSMDEFIDKIKEHKKQLDKARKNSKGQYKFFD